MLKQYAAELEVNDTEDYARVISECYLANRGAAPMESVAATIASLNRAMDARPASPGFIRRLYAPRDPAAIDPSDRVFYTPENADRLDSYRQLIQDEPPRLRSLLMGPLLSAASIHANTAGSSRASTKTGARASASSAAAALTRSIASPRESRCNRRS
jgi:adenine-specific DNA-methyltransferase